MYPLIIRLPWLTISTYSLFFGLAFIIGLHLAVKRGEKEGLSRNFFAGLAILYFVSGILGAKAAHFIIGQTAGWPMYPSDISGTPYLHRILGTGSVLMGGILTASFAGIAWMRIKKIPLLQIHDILSLPAAAGILLGRIGCFFNGCCFGVPVHCDHVLGFDFSHHSSFAAIAQAKAGAACLFGAPLLSAAAMGVIIIVILVWERKPRPPGSSLFIFTSLYFLQRFFMEFIRIDGPGAVFRPGLNLNQILCLIGLAVLFSAAVIVFKKKPLKL